MKYNFNILATKILSTLFFVTGFIFGQEGVVLSQKPYLVGVDNYAVKLVNSNRIMVRSEETDDRKIMIFNLQGEFLFDLDLPGKNANVMDMSYSPWDSVYIVSVHAEGYTQIRLYSENTGLFLGNGYKLVDKEWRKKGVYYQQFIPVGDDRLFASYYNPSTRINDPILREIEIRPYEDGYQFVEIGQPFSPNLVESKLFGGNFNSRWIIQGIQDNNDLCVVDQLQPRVWIYEQAGRENVFKTVDYRPLHLEKRAFPISEYNNQPPTSSQSELEKWYYRFSMVQGLYRVDDRTVVIGYNSPNEEHPWYRFPGDEVVTEKDDMAPYFLHLTFLDNKFKPKGKTKSILGHNLLGVTENGILLFKGESVGPPGHDLDKRRPWEITLKWASSILRPELKEDLLTPPERIVQH